LVFSLALQRFKFIPSYKPGCLVCPSFIARIYFKCTEDKLFLFRRMF
jgi:hypothetical protein